MINKIVDEIHNEKYTMKHLESVQAIDFETIVIINGSVDWSIEDILKDNGYRIYKTNEYKIINGEVCDEEDIYKKQYEIRQESDDHEIGYRKFREWYKPSKTIVEIKIEKDDFYLNKIYKKWKIEQNANKYVQVKDLIKKLKTFNQDAIIGIEDQEFGGFYTFWKYELEDDEDDDNRIIRAKKQRDCPDCNRGCCRHCKSRENFTKECVILG